MHKCRLKIMRFWNRYDKTRIVDWVKLGRRKTVGSLLAQLKEEATLFTSDDLDLMMIHYDTKIRDLPADYRSELSKYARIQITDGYNRLMTKSLSPIHEKVRVSPKLSKFAAVARADCTRGTAGDHLRSLKYLIAAFAMFIEDEPPHPVGMPFPGGGTVELYEGTYYCPVKDAWAGAEAGAGDAGALCIFCPAKQTPALSREERDHVVKKEKLENYFHNYHG